MKSAKKAALDEKRGLGGDGALFSRTSGDVKSMSASPCTSNSVEAHVEVLIGSDDEADSDAELIAAAKQVEAEHAAEQQRQQHFRVAALQQEPSVVHPQAA